MNVTNAVSEKHCYLLNADITFGIEHPTQALFIGQCTACVFITILIIPTVILNGVSVVTILKCPQLKEKVPYFLIIMQSVADLAVGLLSLPLFSYICFTETQGSINCVRSLLLLRVSVVPLCLSIWVLTAMTVERCIGVLHPLRHRTLVTKKRIFVFVSCGALLTIVLIAFSFLQRGLFETFYSVYALIFILVTIFVYTKIFLTIRKRQIPGNATGNTETNKDKHSFLKEIKLAKSCFLVVACFFLCFFGAGIINIMSFQRSHYVVLRSWATALVTVNSSLNSLIFFWCRPLLRNEARKVLKSVRNYHI